MKDCIKENKTNNLQSLVNSGILKVRWKTIDRLKCKKCGKVLGEADFQGVIKKKCDNNKCKAMNIYFRRLGGKIYSFLEKEE